MEKAKKIIFDTDLGGDCDDVVALDLLLALERKGKCEMLGITLSNPAERSAECAAAILFEHGKKGVPIGRMAIKNNDTDIYAKAVYDKFGFHSESAVIEEDAVTLLRKLLSELRDGEKCTLAVTGPLTNIAGLLESQPDGISDLSGVELVLQKVDEIALMGGCLWYISLQNPKPGLVLEDGTVRAVGECNIVADIASSQKVFDLSPVRITVCPFEVGWNTLTGKPMIDRGGESCPDSYSMILYGAKDGRDSWDPTTMLYAVCGARPWFFRSAPGRISILDDGLMVYSYDPSGKHSYIECALSRSEISSEIDGLIMSLF